MIGEEDLRRRFSYHQPTSEERAATHDEIRGILMSAALDIDSLLPDGREKSTAVTKLEEAMFWANAGVARAAAE
jgi:hypothetical protein